MSATELVNCHTWWRGPEYLLQSEDLWPVSKNFDKPQGNDELFGVDWTRGFRGEHLYTRGSMVL